MQTFLPLPSFESSAACLDYRRLGKQRVEAKQLLIAIGVPVGEHEARPGSSWGNHPAARMWRGWEPALAAYGAAVCREWRSRGYKDSLLDQFLAIDDDGRRPDWLGDDDLHASHRSNLLRKLPEHYGRLGWSESPDLPYVWPEGASNG